MFSCGTERGNTCRCCRFFQYNVINTNNKEFPLQNSDVTESICVVTPVYNEEGCIEAVIADWAGHLSKLTPNYKIIAVNDGSRDNTLQKLNALMLKYPALQVHTQENQGHGPALLCGYHLALKAGHCWTFHVDSDNQFAASDFIHLWQIRQGRPFILGHRKNRHDPPVRILISSILRLIIRVFFGTQIKDANIPYRLIETKYLAKLLQFIPEGIFAPNIFLSILAAGDGQDLCHIPVEHQERQTGNPSIIKWSLIKACMRASKELLKFGLSFHRALKTLGQNRA